MTTREALDLLHGEGVGLTHWQLRGLLERGDVPRPRLNSALKFDWEPTDLERVRSVWRRRRHAGGWEK